jgi:CRP/FNR family cyclic AMP-dependent transcriptional regulator
MPKSMPRANVRLAEPPKTLTFLSGLTGSEKKLVLHAAERRAFSARQVIFNRGAPAVNLFLVTRGTIRYYRVTSKGDQVLLWLAAPGDILGIGSLLSMPWRYMGTAEAVNDSEVLVWTRKKIRSLASTYNILTENALRIALQYLAAYSDRLTGLTTETAPQRLAHALFELGRRIGQVRDGAVELAITNEDLGALAHLTPFTASRQLKAWERQGHLRKSRGKVRIFVPEALLSD